MIKETPDLDANVEVPASVEKGLVAADINHLNGTRNAHVENRVVLHRAPSVVYRHILS